MADIYRVKARWAGFTGAPGYTVLHFADQFGTNGDLGPATQEGALDIVTRTRAFFDAIKGTLPAPVSVTVESEVEVLDELSGRLTNSFAVASQLAVNGMSNSSYSVASGAVINWRTAGVRKNRRVRGRSFIVPLVGSQFGTNGALLDATVAQIQDNANVLASQTGTNDLVVYARPTPANPLTGAAAIDDGEAHAVTSAAVPSKGAILTSRRD